MRSAWLMLIAVAGCQGASESAPEPPSAPPAAAPSSAPASPGSAASEKVAAHGGNVAAHHRVAYASSGCAGQAPCTCKGTIGYGTNALAKVGVTAEKLAAGTPCLIEDFDANGFDDLAFVDENYGQGKVAARVMVLMFDEVGLMAVAPLPKRVQTLAVKKLPSGGHALVEPGVTASRYRFVFQGNRFLFQRVEAKR